MSKAISQLYATNPVAALIAGLLFEAAEPVGGGAYNSGGITGQKFLDAVDAAITALSLTSAASGNAAGLITGTLDPARLPVLPSSVQIVSSGAIADLTVPQQDLIGDGSLVTTTDGRRWCYIGTGSKTSEANYIEMADITPDWSVIANKPANVTSLAGLTLAADKGLYATGASTLAVYDLTSAGRALLDDATASDQLNTLGGTSVGKNVFGLTNPSAITFLKVNADNTVTARSAADFRTDLGIGAGDSPTFAGLTFAEAGNLVAGTTTGSKIGTAATQKLGYWGATPVVRAASAALTNDVTAGGTTDVVANVVASVVDSGAASLVSTRNAVYQNTRKLKEISDALRTYGIFT